MRKAEEYLKQIALLEQKIGFLQREVARLEEIRGKITATISPVVVATSGNKDKLSDTTVKIIDLKNEINSAIDQQIDTRMEITEVLLKLQNPDHLSVLEKRYCELKAWEQIGREMKCTARNAQYIRDDALLEVEAILKEGVKNAVGSTV